METSPYLKATPWAWSAARTVLQASADGGAALQALEGRRRVLDEVAAPALGDDGAQGSRRQRMGTTAWGDRARR